MKEPAVTDLFYFLNLIPPKEPQYFWGISSKAQRELLYYGAYLLTAVHVRLLNGKIRIKTIGNSPRKSRRTAALIISRKNIITFDTIVLE